LSFEIWLFRNGQPDFDDRRNFVAMTSNGRDRMVVGFTTTIHLIFLIHNVPYDVGVLVFNASFNNISAISWLSDLLVDDNGVPRENHRPATSKSGVPQE
jgi:hypothetical protein